MADSKDDGLGLVTHDAEIGLKTWFIGTPDKTFLERGYYGRTNLVKHPTRVRSFTRPSCVRFMQQMHRDAAPINEIPDDIWKSSNELAATLLGMRATKDHTKLIADALVTERRRWQV